MTLPLDDLWQAVADKKYHKVKEIICAHPELDLVNAQDSTYGFTLAIYLTSVITRDRPLELIEFVLTHPKVNFNFRHPKTGDTVVSALINSAQAEILQMVIGDHRILMNSDKLTWKCVSERLESAQKNYETSYRKNPESPVTSNCRNKVDNYKKMLPMLRDATILYAIKRDDADLFERLHQEGAKPADFLSNTTLPRSLLTPDNIRLTAWFDSSLARLVQKYADNKNTLFSSAQKMVNLQNQIHESTVSYQEEQARIYLQAGDEKAAKLNKLGTVVIGTNFS